MSYHAYYEQEISCWRFTILFVLFSSALRTFSSWKNLETIYFKVVWKVLEKQQPQNLNSSTMSFGQALTFCFAATCLSQLRILLGNDLPGSLPVRQACKLKVLLPSKKSYLSQRTREDLVLSPSEESEWSSQLSLTRLVGERTWERGCDLLAFAPTWICVGRWKPSIYSWTLSNNHP